MQGIFSALGRTIAKSILIFGLISVLSLSGLFMFADRPALADKLSTKPSEEAIDRAYELSEAAGFKEEDREAAYEKATQAVKDPQGLDKIYEKDLKAFKKANPDEGGLVEGAKNLVDKVTGKED